MKKEYVFCLFAGRHEIPGNPQPIFPEGINPLDFEQLFRIAYNTIPDDADQIRVYLTGLTAATLAVVEACDRKGVTMVALHYDRDTGKYLEQIPIAYDTCPLCGARVPRHAYRCPVCGG